MNKTQHSTEDLVTPSSRILPALLIARIAMRPPSLLTSLLLVDIGLTFSVDVGVAAQLSTVAALIAAISSLLMSILSEKIKHKSLLIIGLICFCLAALGGYMAPTFPMMLVMYAIYGFGLPIVGTMTFTLVASYFPLEKRVSTIGWISASPPAAGILGIPIIVALDKIGGWRLAFLGVALPIAMLSLIVVLVGIPSPDTNKIQQVENKKSIIEGFKEVLSNRSAKMCLLGTGLLIAGRQTILLFSASLFRERFQVSTGIASMIYIGIGLGILFGSILGGQIANRVGKKPVTVITAFFMGVFAIAYTNIANVSYALVLVLLGSLSFGMLFTTSTSLVLEQIPQYRGNMMSLNSAADNIGSSLGAGLGGMMLLMYGYGAVGILLGTMSITSAIIFFMMVTDPTRSRINNN